MLVEFSVNNFKSIKDTVTLSMVADKNDENTFAHRTEEYLKLAAIYGANASGKSNIIEAILFLKNLVLNQSKVYQSTDELPHNPFKLNTETENSPTSFQIIFFIEKDKYRYAVELDGEAIYSEELYIDIYSVGKLRNSETKLFTRDLDKGDYMNPKFEEGFEFFNKKNKKIKVAKNQLFIWKCDQNDGKYSKNILNYFKNNLNILDSSKNINKINLKKLENDNYKEKVEAIIKSIDTGISGIVLEEKSILEELQKGHKLPKKLIEIIKQNEATMLLNIKTKHNKYNNDNKVIGFADFDLQDDESVGTNKFFALLGYILLVLESGGILVVDEIDVHLHPKLVNVIIDFFHNKNKNPKNAQIIFTTHNVNLLKSYKFSRSQIWFTEKNEYGATDLYSLLELKGVRKEDDFAKNYLDGKYGGVPYISELEI